MNDVLYRELNSLFDFNIHNITFQKNLNRYILDTNIGKKIMSKIKLSPNRILFVHGAKLHLYKNGFTNTDIYTCTVFNEPYATIQGSNYVITDSIDGNNCDFSDPGQMASVVSALASLHKASKSYIPPLSAFACSNLSMLPLILEKRLSEIRKVKKLSQKGNSKFDILVSKHIDYFYKSGLAAINMLSSSNYNLLTEKARAEKNFCHNDFSYNNVLHKDGNVMVTNFELCGYELKTYDLINIIRRKMRKCNWDINEAEYMIRKYTSIEPLTIDEFIIMKILFKFPQKFWRIINQYYNSRHSWSENHYCTKLQQVIDEIEPLEIFLDNFNHAYCSN